MFQLFTNTPYVFLLVEQTVEGNEVTSETPAMGVFKLRTSMEQYDNMEQYDGDASIHIKPSESFASNLLGNGIRVGDEEYRIINVVEGKDFDTGQVEFYRAILKKETFAWETEVLS